MSPFNYICTYSLLFASELNIEWYSKVGQNIQNLNHPFKTINGIWLLFSLQYW